MSINDLTIDYVTKFRSGLPRISSNYVNNSSVLLGDMKKDLSNINDMIQAHNTLSDLLNDLKSRIEYNISEHNKMKQEVSQAVHESQTGRFATKNTECPCLISAGSLDYITGPLRPVNQVEGIPISPGLVLPAIQVEEKNMIRADGSLYYIKPLNKFGFWLAGHIFVGNIGEIYTHEKSPQKIKVCSNGANCKNISKCTYYHPGTKDVRNYISGSWIYSARNKNGRTIGSRSSLKNDLENSGNPDIDLFEDQVTHDILCSLVSRCNDITRVEPKTKTKLMSNFGRNTQA